MLGTTAYPLEMIKVLQFSSNLGISPAGEVLGQQPGKDGFDWEGVRCQPFFLCHGPYYKFLQSWEGRKKTPEAVNCEDLEF